MFVVPALAALCLDAGTILLAVRPFADVAASKAIASLAAARLVLFLPLVWAFHHQRKVATLVPILWQTFNLAFLLGEGLQLRQMRMPWGGEWALLWISALSVACQVACIIHLRSSAASRTLKKHVFLRSAVRAMGGGEAFGKRGRSYSMDEEEGSHHRGRHASMEGLESRRFLSNWGEKMTHMQERWGEKLDRLVERLEGFGRGGGGENMQLSPLPLLVKLFAHQEAFDEHEMEVVFAADPTGFEFLLPQYVLFLLYASFDNSQRLERFLLDKSAQNIHLAHRLHWFLVAFCLSGAGISPVGVDAITQMLRELAERGETPAALLAEGAGPGEPESRLARGRSPSARLEAFGRAGNVANSFNANGGGVGMVGFGGRRSWMANASHFMAAPAFVEALCGVARELMTVSKERRTEELRRRLRRVEEMFLPGKVVYVPVGNRRHRVYRIHVEESFAFSTKDRCPFLVTLEVLDYDRPESGGAVGTAADARRRGNVAGGGLAAWARETPLVKGIQRVASSGFQKTFRLGNREFTVRLGDRLGDHSPEGQRGFGDHHGHHTRGGSGGGGGSGSGGILSGSGHAGMAGATGGRRGSESPSASSVMTDSAAGSPTVDRWHPQSQQHRSHSPTESIDFASAGYGFRPLGSGAASPDAAAGDGGMWPLPPPGLAAVAASGRRGSHSHSHSRQQSGLAHESLVSLDMLGSGGHMHFAKRLGMWSSPNLRKESVDDATMGVSVGRVRSVGLDLERFGGSSRARDRALSDTPLSGLRLVAPPSINAIGNGGGPANGRNGLGGGLVNNDRDDSMSYTESEVTPSPTPRSLMQRTAGAAGSGGGGFYGGYGTYGSGDSGGAPAVPVVAVVSANGRSASGDAKAAADRSGSTGAVAAPPRRRLGFGSLSLPFLRGKSEVPAAAAATPAAPVAPVAAAAAATAAGVVPAAGGGGIGSSTGGGKSEVEKAPLLARRKRSVSAVPQPPTIAVAYPSPGGGGNSGRGGMETVPSRGFGGLDSLDDEGEARGRAGSGASDSSASAAAAAAYVAVATVPPRVIFREKWRQKEHRLRRQSKVGHLRGWRLVPIIVKSGDDLRQEQVASQLMHQIHHIVSDGGQPTAHGLRAWLRPYDIVATSPDSGVIEAVPDTVSLDALKKNDPQYTTLVDFYERHFGCDGDDGFLAARTCFIESLAAYCVATYLLQIKDRHNGNILLDAQGHVIHIDYGFMLANSPGGNFNFESAPFKLTAEFIELMDGPKSQCFKQFRLLCVDTFMLLRRQMHKVTLLAEMCSVGNGHLPCFAGQPDRVVDDLRKRFRPDLHDRAAVEFVHDLVDRSMRSWRTSFYDKYQQCFVGIR